MSTQWARPSGDSWGRNVNDAPKRDPSPSASRTSSPVSPTMTPMSLSPTQAIASIPSEDRGVGYRDELLGAGVGDRSRPGYRCRRRGSTPSWRPQPGTVVAVVAAGGGRRRHGRCPGSPPPRPPARPRTCRRSRRLRPAARMSAGRLLRRRLQGATAWSGSVDSSISTASVAASAEAFAERISLDLLEQLGDGEADRSAAGARCGRGRHEGPPPSHRRGTPRSGDCGRAGQALRAVEVLAAGVEVQP